MDGRPIRFKGALPVIDGCECEPRWQPVSSPQQIEAGSL